MIRFVDLGTQISQDREFAWYDTIVDQFIRFSDSYTWETLEGFVEDYHNDAPLGRSGGYPLTRFLALFPYDSWDEKIT